MGAVNASPPFGRYVISLKKDRRNGEFFPAFEGAFFYVESVDLPCRISFGVASDSQAIAISSGFQLNSPFSDITLFHDDYSNVGAALSTFTIVVYISAHKLALNQFVLPTVNYHQPWAVAFVDARNYQIAFPVYTGSKKFSLRSLLQVSSAANPGISQTLIRFNDINGVLILGPINIVVAGTTFNQAGSLLSTYLPVLALSSGLWGYVFNVDDVPIPSLTAYITVVFSFDVDVNVIQSRQSPLVT